MGEWNGEGVGLFSSTIGEKSGWGEDFSYTIGEQKGPRALDCSPESWWLRRYDLEINWDERLGLIQF